MPEYLAPGVYVEEVDTGPKPIEGVSTSTSGMVGVTERGPEDIPTLVIGFADFTRQFGGYLDDDAFPSVWYLPHAVKGFFDNGGKRLYIVRVLPVAAKFADVQLYDRGETLQFSTALGSRAELGETVIIVADATAINSGDTVLITDGSASEYLEVGKAGDILGFGTPLVAAHAANGDVNGYTLTLDPTPRKMKVAVAGAQAITLDDVTNLAGIGGDWLQIDSAPYREFVRTTFADPADATKPVRLARGLAFPHAVDAPVRRITATPLLGTTKLLLGMSLGNSIAVVVDANQLAGAQAIGFGGATPTELHVMLDDMEIRTLSAALAMNHNAGAPVVIPALTVDGTARKLTADASAGLEQIALDRRDNLAVGSVLRIRTGNTDEYVIIEDIVLPNVAAPNPGVVSITSGLKHGYTVANSEIRLITDQNNDASETLLMRDANSGETVVLLGDATPYAANGVIRIEATNSPLVEYHQIVAGTNAILPIHRAVAAAHNVGLAVSGRSELMVLQAIDRGAWGNSLKAYAQDEQTQRLADTVAVDPASIGDTSIKLATTVGIEPGSILEFYNTQTRAVQFRQKADGLGLGSRVTFTAGLDQGVTAGTGVRTREFRLTVELTRINPYTQKEEVVPGMSETHRHLSLDPRHSRYIETVIGQIQDGTIPERADGRTDGESDLVRCTDTLSPAQAEALIRFGPDIILETLPDGRVQIVKRGFAGGDDAVNQIGDSTYSGIDALNPNDRTGLHALKNIEEISIVSIPGRTSQTLQQELITHCELMRYRFGVIDPPPRIGIAEVQAHRGLYDTKYAAIYYPWLEIQDPFPPNPRLTSYISIPPSGHTMGIYARSDIERGVHKAPANEVIRGISDLEQIFYKEHQDILNPRNINVLRDFRPNNRGLRVWGARVMSSDPDWRYVNVRRLFIFIEHSIDRGTQWVVFEPNSEPLWERVRRVVSSFLLGVWRDGALMGRTPEEAFFVKCDRSTMTQADIDNGKLIVLVGIAPVKPAEFVIFRIGQKAGGSELDEG